MAVDRWLCACNTMSFGAGSSLHMVTAKFGPLFDRVAPNLRPNLKTARLAGSKAVKVERRHAGTCTDARAAEVKLPSGELLL